MADATFDGINLIITLPPGQILVDTERDLYSAWKRFMLADKENMRFPIAFRGSEGGTPLTGSLDTGAYFFLQNQFGWRIRPSEEDITINFTGNLVPEDLSLPLIIPTIGDFTVLILGLQPITQGVQGLVLIEQMLAGEVEISLDDRTVTVYDKGGVAGGVSIAVFDISADGRTRLRTS